MDDKITKDNILSAVAMRPDGVDEHVLCEALAGGQRGGSTYASAARAISDAIAGGAVRSTSDCRVFLRSPTEH